MTKRDEHELITTVRREFDQLRELMGEHYAAFREHIKLDDTRQVTIATALEIQTAKVNAAHQQMRTFVLWGKWLVSGSGAAGAILAALTYLQR